PPRIPAAATVALLTRSVWTTYERAHTLSTPSAQKRLVLGVLVAVGPPRALRCGLRGQPRLFGAMRLVFLSLVALFVPLEIHQKLDAVEQGPLDTAGQFLPRRTQV